MSCTLECWLQSTHHITEREREKGGRAIGQRLIHTHFPSHTLPFSQISDNRAGVLVGRYAAVKPACRDLERASWTNCGLTAGGYFKGGILLSYQVVVSLWEQFGVSGVSFQIPSTFDSRIWLTKALPKSSHVFGCNLKVWLVSKPGDGCSKTFKSGMWNMTLMLFWICQCVVCAANKRGVHSSCLWG